ncbi:thiol reductant ABC exporter subunit CydD [Tenggerimyces flavus]|uniref:Thiol reductant ABC exporter subunit CydD n=1 Tax=Tenggerimyces flavus TaxID=1708749 RepID=A0ABV7Y9U8_9ACTN|nr:thiol reductant ABC exporter subunit CydD [Tenggerimyces flavus]MBM7786685.1 thiol reductant ABC exporter CydD subunit [Tenggerimyces flavus]
MRPLDPRLLRYAKATAPYVAACILVGAATAGLVIAQATLLASAIAHVTTAGLVPLAAIVLGRALLAWGQEVAAHRASAAVKASLREQLVRKALALGPHWLANERKAALTTLATRGLDALDGYFARYLPQLVLAVVVPAAIVVWLVANDLIAGITVAITLPLIPVFMALVGLATRDRANRSWRALAVLAHHFADVVAGLPTLKIFGRAKTQAEAIRRVGAQHRRESLSLLRVAFLSGLVLELVATFSVALVAVGIGVRLVEGRLDLETALLVLILAPEAYVPLRLVGAHFHASADGLAAADEAFRVLETPALQTVGFWYRHAGVSRPEPHSLGAWLVVEGLTVQYPGDPEPVVEDLSFEVRPGELVALAGPSGAGKSSVLNALVATWRTQVGWVPQRPYLLDGSVADNVGFGNPAGDVERALADAGAQELDPATQVGEGGKRLSEGQRRRVALARALIRGVPVLLLDEPTAGVDAETEADIAAMLRRSGRTVVLVTHHPALLAAADRVVDVRPCVYA